MNNTISAVMFVYNEERYLQEMIDSLLKQTIKIDEIIIVDDFSTDETKHIILENAKTNRSISYNQSEQKGKVNAYKKGLSLVKTDYFFICAGDDKLMLTFVEEMLGFISKNKTNYAYSNYVVTNKDLTPLYTPYKKTCYTTRELIIVNHVSGYLFGKREILSKILPLPEGLIFEDWYTSIKLSNTFGENYINPKPLFFYRRHANASTVNDKYSKTKYLHHLQRDIKLFDLILDEGFITNSSLKSLIILRRSYLKVLKDFSLYTAVKLLFRREISSKEKFKLIFFPIFFRIRYK